MYMRLDWKGDKDGGGAVGRARGLGCRVAGGGSGCVYPAPRASGGCDLRSVLCSVFVSVSVCPFGPTPKPVVEDSAST